MVIRPMDRQEALGRYLNIREGRSIRGMAAEAVNLEIKRIVAPIVPARSNFPGGVVYRDSRKIGIGAQTVCQRLFIRIYLDWPRPRSAVIPLDLLIQASE